MKSKLDNMLNKARLLLFRLTSRRDSRALLLLSSIGIVVGIIWLFNAKLVYDDVILVKDLKAFGFQYITVRDGWFRALIHFLLLDLPDQYRTYGLARTFQFLLWTFGISSAASYSTLISFFQIISALSIYGILTKLRFEKSTSLAFGILWMISPYIWTSCFHHFSYTILPSQILIIGSLLLMQYSGNGKTNLLAIILGIILGLTGELHLLAVPIVLFAIALATKKRFFLQAVILTAVSMISAIAVHYLLWRIFESDPSMHQRFALSLSHNFSYWISLAEIAAKSVYFSFVIPIIKLSDGNLAWLGVITFIFALGIFASFVWIDRGSLSSTDNLPNQNEWQLAVLIFSIACSYLLIFVLVGVLSSGIPHTMPRRYGFVPLTLVLMAVCTALSASVKRKEYKYALTSLFLGIVASFFVWHQVILVPKIRAADNALSAVIANETKKDPRKGVLFFNASNAEFPRSAINPDSLGPAMQSTEDTELTQATYGTYWPAEMNITRIIGSQFACDIVGPLKNGGLRTACPYGSTITEIEKERAIVVANLGFDEFDPFGKNVRVFQNFDKFEPYFFSRRIVDSADQSMLPQGDYFQIDFGKLLSESNKNNTLKNKGFDAPLSSSFQPWIKNYGWRSAPNCSTNESDKAYLDYAFDFQPSDLDVYLDFRGKLNRPSKNETFNIQVSWNEGAWVSLGIINATQESGGKPFSIQLSHLDTNSFEFKLGAANNGRNTLPLQSIRIAKREPVNPSYSSITSATDLVGDWKAGEGTAKISSNSDGTLQVTDERGSQVSASIQDGSISVPGWDVSGKITEDLQYIHWSNGFKWFRIFSQQK
jgi:hypothetical protein